eukprot:SAG25_NODE_260_length_10806_cov_39.327356_1_plen_158_part_00
MPPPPPHPILATTTLSCPPRLPCGSSASSLAARGSWAVLGLGGFATAATATAAAAAADRPTGWQVHTLIRPTSKEGEPLVVGDGSRISVAQKQRVTGIAQGLRYYYTALNEKFESDRRAQTVTGVYHDLDVAEQAAKVLMQFEARTLTECYHVDFSQ